MKETDFPIYLTRYLSIYLPTQKNVSTNTIASYRDTFKLLLIFYETKKGQPVERLNMRDFTRETILEFLDWLEENRKCSISTRNHRLAVIHSFCRYIQKEVPENLHQLQRILTISNKKTSKPIVPYLTGDEMKILLEQPHTSTKEGFREMVILTVLYDTGARVQELIDLKYKDIRLAEPAVITLHGKGNKTRQIPIMGQTYTLLKKYMSMNPYTNEIAKDEQYLFLNQKKQKLSRWGVSYIIDKNVATARENPLFNISFPITPHVFRHSKAMHLTQSGVYLIYIRDFLGHVDCSTTEIYARADSEMKRKAIESAYIDITPDKLPNWEDDSNLMQWLNSLCK